MAKKEFEQLEKRVEGLEKRVELLEMQIKEMKSVENPLALADGMKTALFIFDQRFKSIEDTLYSTKDILNMKEVCQYLDISQSLLYKLTCNGEIPHFKPRGKMIFFEKKELIKWIKKNAKSASGKNRKNSKSST